MSVWIVLEQESDLAIVKALLPDEIQFASKFIAVGQRSNISSVARTLLVKHKEPVAVVVNINSFDGPTIREKYLLMEELLRAVSGGTPFKVIPCFPVLEAIFFNAAEIMERIFPKWRTLFDPMYFCKTPKDALADLFVNGGGPKTLSKLLDALTEEDVERLRATGPIRELITFVDAVVRPVEKQGAS
jgi:hypothetical protein